MEIKINLDLAQIIGDACSAEKLQPIISKAITETVKDAIESATGYRSAFRQAVTTQLAEAMPHGLRLSDVVKFQSILNSAMEGLVQDANNATIKAAMEKAAKSVMPDVPARIKLSNLMEEARGGLHKSTEDNFFACYEEDGYGLCHLYLDSSDYCTHKHDARISLSLSKDSGEAYRLKLYGKNVTPSSVPTVVGKFDSLLMALYVGRATLEIDIDEDEVKSLAAKQYD